MAETICECPSCVPFRTLKVTSHMREELEEAVMDGDLDRLNEILAKGEE